MDRLIFVAQTNVVSADAAADFELWYVHVHLKEVTAAAGFRSGQLFRLIDAQRAGVRGPQYRYLAIYEGQGDPQEVLKALAEAGPIFQMSPALASDVLTAFYGPVGKMIS
jgi:hypothetical protein